MPDPGEPGPARTRDEIRTQDARDACARPWPNRQQAAEQAAWLRQAGWQVDIQHPMRLRSGAVLYAHVVRPSGKVLGVIAYREAP
jgi:hypothetical protein